MIFFYPYIFIFIFSCLYIFSSFTKDLKTSTAININIFIFLINIAYFMGVLSFYEGVENYEFLNSFISIDKISIFINITLSVAMLFTLYSIKIFYKEGNFKLENLFIINVVFLASSAVGFCNELISIFILLEITSFGAIVLIGLNSQKNSGEAMIKYLFLNSFMSAFYLLGLTFVALFYGSTHLYNLYDNLGSIDERVLAFILPLFIASILFKVGGFLFYNYSIDAYNATNAPITGYFLSSYKILGFVLLFKLLLFGFLKGAIYWQYILMITSIITMFAGNLLSIKQNKIKGILVNSSITHTGYILLGFASLNIVSADTISPIFFYILTYAFLSVLVFMVLSNFKNINDLKNLNEIRAKSPLSAFVIALAMFAYIGLPFSVGFLSKFYLLFDAAKNGAIMLVSIAIINTIISIFYYLRIISAIYFNPINTQRFKTTIAYKAVLVFGVLIIFLGGIGFYTPTDIAALIGF